MRPRVDVCVHGWTRLGRKPRPGCVPAWTQGGPHSVSALDILFSLIDVGSVRDKHGAGHRRAKPLHFAALLIVGTVEQTEQPNYLAEGGQAASLEGWPTTCRIRLILIAPSCASYWWVPLVGASADR
eukprot:1158546-Pelagomonas_calceolata.AAC.12